jgi:DNA repair protein RadD
MYQQTITEVKQGYDLQLLPLQQYMLDETRKAFGKSKRIILQAGCGAGKTIIATQIAKNALGLGKRVLFIADRIVLCNQTSDVFMKYGIPHGVIQSQNSRFDIHQPCQVCSIQTLKLRGCPAADVIIIDEAHVLHEEHIRIMNENPNAYILGLTASPYTKGLGKHFDFHIQPVPVKKLIEEKYLVPFDIYGPSIADLSKLKVRAGDYTEKSLSEAYDKADILGDVVKTWQKLTPGKKTIVFGVNVAHIKHLKDQFIAAGISACEINAYQTDAEREEELDGFINRNTMVLCSVEVATKGLIVRP